MTAEFISASIGVSPQQRPDARSISIDLAPPSLAAVMAGQAQPVGSASAATGDSPLRVRQAAMTIGEPLPVVFCRRRETSGGVLLFPKATEARFENDATTVTSKYHMVLSEGYIGTLQVREVRCGECRIGSFSQYYNGRAGTWVAGNFLTAQTGYTVPTATTFTGGGGNYSGLSTFEAGATFTGGSDEWATGWNVFVRDGMRIDRGRLVDATVGPSDNIADLVLWAWQASSRIPASMIDLASMQKAAIFCEANGFYCNGEFKDSQNLGDFLLDILPHFLLKETKVGGKYSLRPLLPVDGSGNIKTTALTPKALLNEASIVPGSFNMEYNEASIMRPPVFNMIWRQQADVLDPPVTRTTPVGSANWTSNFEQVDLSGFCDTELHAVRIGAYMYWRRLLSTHTATLKLIPGTQSGQLQEGDIIQIYLAPENDREETMPYNAWYQIDSIVYAFDGGDTLTLSHFPVDDQGRSLISLAVMAATASGDILPTMQTGSSCDLPGRTTDYSTLPRLTSGTPLIEGNIGSQAENYNSAQNVNNGAFGGGYNTGGFNSGADTPAAPVGQPGGGFSPPAPGPGQPGGGAPGTDCPLGYEGYAFTVNVGFVGTSSGSVTTYQFIGQPVVTGENPTPATSGPPSYTYLAGDPWSITGTAYPSGTPVSLGDDGTTSLLLLVSAAGPLGGCKPGGSEPNPTLPSPPACPWTHTVAPGDTLWGLAHRYYGNGSLWPIIYAANSGTIGSDPNYIVPGQTLTIPCPP